MGRKPLLATDETLKTAEDVLIYQKFIKEEWALCNKEKLFNYNRKKCLQRCIDRVSIPTINTVRKYKFEKSELEPIFASLLNKILDESEKVTSQNSDDSE